MSALPTKLRVKRKREDASVGQLYLQEQQELEPHPRKRLWQYTLQPTFTSAAEVQRAIETESTASQNGTLATATQEQQTREFRIAPSRKRKAGDADIATFVEAKKARSSASDHATADAATQSGTAAREVKPLKRPGAGARLGHGKAAQQREEAKKLASSAAREERTNALAESLNRFAQETLEREREKPRLTVKPKVPALRLRDRHPERFAPVAGSNGSAADMDVDVDMDGSDEEGYVYDTYVRYQHPVVPSTLDASDPANVQIGYIVITEEDNPIWETYFEEEGSEEDVLSDDEDENAEGYYAADYPEDEVASDDEFDRGAYGYRHGGSDDEQWDDDAGAFSDEEDQMRNPWKKYPWQRGHGHSAGLVDDQLDNDDD